MDTSQQDVIQYLPIDQLQPNPFQPRSKIIKDDLEELIASVKAYGVLEPLVIAQTPAGYQIIAGERRWRAAREVGLPNVPVVIKKTTPKGMLEMALVENVQRVELTPIERAQAFRQLISEFKFTVYQLAEKIGKSAPYISNTMRLLELPDAIKDGLLGGHITEGHARAIMTIPDEKVRVECYKVILKENASVRRAEDLARRFKERFEVKEGADRGRPVQISDTRLAMWQTQFQSLFNAKSKLKVVRSHRQTRITLTMHGSPEQTQADFEKFLAFADARMPQKHVFPQKNKDTDDTEE